MSAKDKNLSDVLAINRADKRKTPLHNKTVKTELGLEKCCTKCNELYPLESDFYYRDGKDKNGQTRFTTFCKDCYKKRYRSKPKKEGVK